MTSRKRHPLDTTGQLHIGTDSRCDSTHETRDRTHETCDIAHETCDSTHETRD